MVWQLDNRGSANRGHKLSNRRSVPRLWEQHELEDQLKAGVELSKAVRALWTLTRIGITGWSYGGYMTLYSVLNERSRR